MLEEMNDFSTVKVNSPVGAALFFSKASYSLYFTYSKLSNHKLT